MAERDPLELNTREGELLLERAHAAGTALVVLTGGDPAKRADLVHLVRYGTNLGLRMALTPSATPLVTRELLLELRDAGLARVAVSLDAATAAAHDGFRGVAGSYAKTFEILKTARELGMTTQVNTTVTHVNIDELETIAGLLEPLEIELWGVFFIVPTGRAQVRDVLEPAQVESVLERLATLSETAPFDIKTTAAPHYRRVLLQRKVSRREITGIADGIGRAPRGVNDGQGILFVSHRGDLSPSGFLPVRCGNVRSDDLGQVYREHALFLALRDADQLGGKCGVCEFRHVCGGSRARAFAMTGDALAEEPACAYVPREQPGKPTPTRSASAPAREHLVVIGGGVAGLAAAFTARRANPGVRVTLLEASTRVGGLVETEHTSDGLVLEQGPDGWVREKSSVAELIEALGFQSEIITREASAARSYIATHERLVPMPPGLFSFGPGAAAALMASPLLSAKGKLRLACEPSVAARRDESDESVASFIERRFGRELLDRVIEPVLGGIYGASADRLSANVVLARLVELERSHGSLAAATLLGARRASDAVPTMVSLERGMGSLPDALADSLGSMIRRGAPVARVERGAGCWSVHLADGGQLSADAIVLATPAWVTARILEGLDPTLAAQLSSIAATNLDLVSLAWPRAEIPHALDGSGFVATRNGRWRLTASTWSSRKWRGRAPQGQELLRCFGSVPDADDAEVIRAVREDLRDLLGIEAEPVHCSLRRRRQVLPIYEPGHQQRVTALRARLASWEGLALAGNAYDGTGIPDCVASGARAARELVGQRSDRGVSAEMGAQATTA